ncbi:MAG: sulfatase/phosphatase domain-containing protein, partial [Planctomycetota bacterium]
NYYPYFLRHNDKKVMLPGNEGKKTEQYGPDLIQAQTLKFIEANKDRPFFMYVPHVIPHAELLVPEDDIVESYRGKFPEKPYKGTDDGPNYKIGGYGSVETPRANFAAMVTRLDRHVGEILEKLRQLGLDEKTLVMFTSDNPMIARWPGRITAGSGNEHISAFWDVMPTLAELAGADVPADIDGISFAPTLLGKPQEEHEYLYWEFHEQGGKQAVRKGKWKAIRLQVKRDPNGPLELYDLQANPEERNDVASQYPDIVGEMAQIMTEAHTDSDVFLFGQSAYRGDRKSK